MGTPRPTRSRRYASTSPTPTLSGTSIAGWRPAKPVLEPPLAPPKGRHLKLGAAPRGLGVFGTHLSAGLVVRDPRICDGSTRSTMAPPTLSYLFRAHARCAVCDCNHSKVRGE